MGMNTIVQNANMSHGGGYNSQVTIVESFDFGGHVWCHRLGHSLFDWEVGEMIRLLSVLEELKSDSSKRDSWEWVINSKGTLTSKSLYSELVNHTRVFFPIKTFGSLIFPLKSHSFNGTCIWVRFLPLTISRVEVEIWLTYTFYV